MAHTPITSKSRSPSGEREYRSGESGKLECTACGNHYEPEALEMLNTAESGEQIAFERPKEGFQADEEGVQIYHCKNCGAELMTEDTTTAAECPYCGSPTILPDRLEGGVKPEKVIPFVVTKEQAQKQFEDYFKGKRLLPNIFLNSRNRIAEMRRLYVPYWLFDCDARADIVYDAQTTTTEQEGEMSLSGHLRELRNRILVCIVVLVVAILAGLHYAPQIVQLFLQMGKDLDYEFVYIAPQELMLQYFYVSFLFGICVTIPVLLYQAWAFIRPGLKKSENFLFLIAMVFGLLCFCTGAIFAYPFQANKAFSSSLQYTFFTSQMYR